MKKYKTSMAMLEENLDLLKSEIYVFSYKSRKKAGIAARSVLINIKKICHSLRNELNEDIKALPKPKRNITPEAIEAAKIKRKNTMDKKNKLKKQAG